MRCPNCGGYSFDSDDRCLNCGHVISFEAKPPSWWGSQALRKSNTTSGSKQGTANIHSARLTICPKCRERSLFYNEKDAVYECLNKKCRARGSSPDEIDSVPHIRRQRSAEKQTLPSHAGLRQTSARSKITVPTPSANVAGVWFASVGSKLSFWWKWHKPRRFKITKRGLSTSWGLFKKCLVLASLVLVTSIIFVATSLVISKGISIISGVIIGTLGLTLVVWCSNSLSLRKVSFARFFMIVVISAIFIMISTAYLDIKSFGDVRDSIIGALSIAKS